MVLTLNVEALEDLQGYWDIGQKLKGKRDIFVNILKVYGILGSILGIFGNNAF